MIEAWHASFSFIEIATVILPKKIEHKIMTLHESRTLIMLQSKKLVQEPFFNQLTYHIVFFHHPVKITPNMMVNFIQ
jgi:hypothetical protein